MYAFLADLVTLIHFAYVSAVVVGQLLTAHPGTWSGSEPISYTYQWQLCNNKGESCTNIAEATGLTLGLLNLELNKTVDVVVTATASLGVTLPNFVVAPLLQLAFGLWLKVLPVGGYAEGAPENLVLPIVVLAATVGTPFKS